MSKYFEVLLSLDLRPDLAEPTLEEVRWHLGLGPAPADPSVPDGPLLEPADVSYLPGGEITRFGREYRLDIAGVAQDSYGLLVRRFMLDDRFQEVVAPLLAWLPPIAMDGFIGFWRGEDELIPTVIVARGGHAYVKTVDRPMAPATDEGPPWSEPDGRALP